MLNLNYNINRAIGGGGCIGVVKYNYSASILVAGGGGGIPALVASAARGGGGAGFVWTGSLSIIPNVSYQILVAQTSSLGGVGNESKFIGFDDNDTIPFTVTSLGGQIQTPNAVGTFDGGAQGSGSLSRAGVLTNYSGYVGGLGAVGTRGGYFNAVGGGGAGARSNGGNGDINGAGGAIGGIGGNTYDAADFYPAGAVIAAGGSGESIGGASTPQAIVPSDYSQGASYNGTVGAEGGCVIRYAGKPKAEITNGTTVYESGSGFTYHTFNVGTGSFIYTVPYPYEEPVTAYTVEQCPPTAQPPFVPFPRTDLYSASLVLAIPGAIFTNGYNNVFNQITPYDDIAPYIVSGSILNPNTGKYNPYTNTHSLDFTGSLGFYTASVSVNNFTNVGYETSLLFSGSICLRVSKDIGVGNGVNLSTTKPFVIEGWAAMDVTSSIVSNTGRIFAQKYISGNPLTSSFYSVVNFAGDPGNLVSGSILFTGNNISNPSAETVVVSMSSSLDIPKQFRHFAISNTPISGVQSTIRTYVSGILQGQQTFNYDFDLNPQLFVQLFGDEGEGYLNAASASQVAGGYFQDFRMYNGTNKNYTGSLIPIPQSMIQGLVEPYPIVN
jgi:hypothetical protein